MANAAVLALLCVCALVAAADGAVYAADLGAEEVDPVEPADLANLLQMQRGRQAALAQQPAEKFIAGVPVYNYHLARQGTSTSGEGKEEWVVFLKPGATNAQIDALCALSADNACETFGRPSEGGVPFLEVEGTEASLAEIVEAAAEAVEFIEPNLPVRISPPDTRDMPPLHQFDDREAFASWGLARVGARHLPLTGKGVHVYVLDTGIRATHVDFAGRAIPTLDLSDGSLVECKDRLTCAHDQFGHGTHCAAIAGGATYGVAPQATLHAAKVLSDDGTGEGTWSLAALDWIVAKGKRPAVASMSLGGSGRIVAFQVAIDVAVNAGVTVVVAAGNDNEDACASTPGFVPSAFTVGATTPWSTRAAYSNFGACTKIWAPGSYITSAWSTSDTASRVLSGTSMACPHVSGAAALLLEASPNLKPSQVREVLLRGALPGTILGLGAADRNKFLFVGHSLASCPASFPWAHQPLLGFTACCATANDCRGGIGVNSRADRSLRGDCCERQNSTACDFPPCTDYRLQ